MARVRDLLYRFRPVGTPGAASATGVPADRVANLTVELEPLFALLVATERDRAAIIETAERDAAAIRARDAERARVIVASARSRASAERAAVSAKAGQGAMVRSADLLAAAERDAVKLREVATSRIPSYVAAVLASTRTSVEAQLDQPSVGVT
jgi:hypothetical protein